jgi:hypothetical protein
MMGSPQRRKERKDFIHEWPQMKLNQLGWMVIRGNSWRDFYPLRSARLCGEFGPRYTHAIQPVL